ncbi:MAG: N-acetyltransferase [Bacteroidales bacterium]|nr:N-acetyltransferase [Bacteroidales bacterium]
MKIKVRPEARSESEIITQINDMAFGREDEGNLVNSLKKRLEFIPELSFIALFGDQPVGHLLLFPVIIKGESSNYKTLSLAPMSVMPEFQGLGIGSELIKTGLAKAKELGYKSVVVLGHADYYPKFGFTPASAWKITSPFEAPDENFMAIELIEGALTGKSGVIEYPNDFYKLT